MQKENGVNRNELVERYQSYAHALAAEFLRKVPAQVDKDDVIGYAELGLVEAANAFDPTNGVHFKTFSYYRIRGAIYDGLRKLGGLPREFYRHLKMEGAANAYLADYSTQASAVSGPAQYDEIKNMCGNIVSTYLLSLDVGGADPASVEHSPDQLIQIRELNQRLRQSVERLPEKNRRVITDYYFKDLSLEEIGKALGLSKSWVCRIHARSIEMLRAAIIAQPASRAPQATVSGVVR